MRLIPVPVLVGASIWGLILLVQANVSLKGSTDYSRISIPPKTIKEIWESFLPQIKDSQFCTNVYVTNKTNLKVDFSQEPLPMFVISPSYVLRYKESLIKILRKVSTCPIIIGFEDNAMKVILKVTNEFQHTIAIQIRGKKPKMNEVSNTRKPVAWVAQERSKMELYIFCPKEDPLKSQWIKTTTQSNGAIKNCPHYLSGLSLARGSVKTKDFRLINGKKVYGSYATRIFEYLSKKFRFVPRFVHGLTGRHNPRNNTWNGLMGKLESRQIFAASSSVRELMGRHFDLTSAFIEDPFRFLSAEPKILSTYNSLLLPLNILVWAAVMASIISLSVIFYITYLVYSSQSNTNYLLRHSGNYKPLRFLLYTMCKVKDPASIPWFRDNVSTGRFLAFQYTVFCFMITAMYSCNLHAHLVAVGREKPIDTAQDVIDNGKRPWIMSEMGVFRKAVAEQNGLVGTQFFKILEMAEKHKGYYSYHKNRGFPEHGLKDILNNRAVSIINARMHHEIFSPRYKC